MSKSYCEWETERELVGQTDRHKDGVTGENKSKNKH